MKTDLSQYSNHWYHPGSHIKRMLWYLCSLLFFQNHLFLFSSFKIAVLRLFGAHIGKGVVLKPNITIKYPWKLQIGNHVWIGEDVWIDNLAEVQIFDHVCVSQGAYLLTGNHDYKKVEFDLIVKPIILEEGVWIGAKSIVCPGVVCRSHSVLAVGSIATKELKSFSIYQGNPAVKIKDRIILTTTI